MPDRNATRAASPGMLGVRESPTRTRGGAWTPACSSSSSIVNLASGYSFSMGSHARSWARGIPRSLVLTVTLEMVLLSVSFLYTSATSNSAGSNCMLGLQIRIRMQLECEQPSRRRARGRAFVLRSGPFLRFLLPLVSHFFLFFVLSLSHPPLPFPAIVGMSTTMYQLPHRRRSCFGVALSADLLPIFRRLPRTLR